MKICIFGAGGYLGRYFSAKYPEAATPKVDIADANAVADILDAEQPDVVINCAGKTGRPNVDWCEDHKMETVHSNVLGPLVLLEACDARDIYMVHIGTGCVYSGDETHPFTEEDVPNFRGSFYSRSKGAIDQLLNDFPVLNVRLRMPFDGSTNERSLINKIKNYERVLDVGNSMTYIPDLLSAVDQLIQKKATGAYNIVNPGTMSPYMIMTMYKEIVDPNHNFELLQEKDLPDVAKAGRSNCVLDGSKLANEGIIMRPVEKAVEESLLQMKG